MGTTIYFSALTSALGFAILTLSPIPLIRNFGLLIALSIIYSFFASMIIVPVGMGWWSVRHHNKIWSSLRFGELISTFIKGDFLQKRE